MQRQVEFLDDHKDYVLTYSNALVVDENSVIINKLRHKRYSGWCAKSLITEGNYIVTAGVCYRGQYDEECNEKMAAITFDLLLGDKPLWLMLSMKGKFYFFEDYMVAYRMLEESASHTKDYAKALKFSDCIKNINLYFNKLFCLGIPEERILQDSILHKLILTTLLSWGGLFKEFMQAASEDWKILFRKRYWRTLVRALKEKMCN